MDNFGIRITEIEFIPITPNNGLVGFVKIILNDCYLLEGIAVYICKDRPGYRLTYPKRKLGDKSISIHYPTKPEISELIVQEVNKKVTEFYCSYGDMQFDDEEEED